MTEILHSAQTNLDGVDPVLPATSRVPEAVDSTASSGSSTPGPVAFDARVAAHSNDSTLLADALSTLEIKGFSTRHLRVLANRAYQLMDTDYPPAGTVKSYKLIVGELESRTQQGASGRPVHHRKETFRDNPLYCRFELLIDGSLAAYMRYTMKGGQVVLTDGIEHPGFRDQGMDTLLMRHIVLNAHKRRLNLIAQCPMAFSFLADHPQYQALTAHPPHQDTGL